MAETQGTKSAIEDWENIPRNLQKLDMAELIKDTSGTDSKNYIRVYNIFVGSGLDMVKVCWRFHYDDRPGAKSSLRISNLGMQIMFKSMTVMYVLRKLNMKVSNGDKYDIEKLREVMAEAVVVVDNRKSEVNKNETVAKT